MIEGFKIPQVTFRIREGDTSDNEIACAIGGKWTNKSSDDFFIKKSSEDLFVHFPPIAHAISLSEVSPSLILKVTWGILNPSIIFFNAHDNF